jgi:hypothetical protein
VGRIWLSDSPSPFALLKWAPFGEAAKALLAFSTLRIAGGVYFMIHLIVVLNFRSDSLPRTALLKRILYDSGGALEWIECSS